MAFAGSEISAGFFMPKTFTKEIKEMFTEAINHYVKEESEKSSVFQQGGVYLPIK